MDHKGSCTNNVIADRIMITVLAELGGKSPPPIAEFFWQIWGVPPFPLYEKICQSIFDNLPKGVQN